MKVREKPMEGVGLLKKAKTNHRNPKKRIAREGHARDGAWELGYWRSCLRWIDQASMSQLVGVSCQ